MNDLIINKSEYLKRFSSDTMLLVNLTDNNSTVKYNIVDEIRQGGSRLVDTTFTISDDNDYLHINMLLYRFKWESNTSNNIKKLVTEGYIPYNSFTVIRSGDILTGYRLSDLYDNRLTDTDHYSVTPEDYDCGTWRSEIPTISKRIKIPLYIPTSLTYDDGDICEYINPLLLKSI